MPITGDTVYGALFHTAYWATLVRLWRPAWGAALLTRAFSQRAALLTRLRHR